MKEYKIGEEADCAEANTRHAIRSLLDRVKEQIGFDTEGEEIFVQLYTSKHGGCELFITKCDLSEALSEEDTVSALTQVDADIKSMHKEEKKQFLPAVSEENHKRKDNGKMAFSFPSLEELCGACRVLFKSGKEADSTAYIDEEERCYLLLSGVGSSAYSRLDRLSFLYEYGKRESVDCLLSYINEHGHVLCPADAIEILGTL